MRVVVVGTGQLGRELARVLPGADTVVLSRAELDLTDTAAVAPRLAALAPSAVVNAAADNRVDPAPAMAVNALGVAALAEACRRTGALLVHMSTDYVFDGRAGRPYTEDDPPSPLGAYARSKLAGELLARALAPRHAVVRLAALYAAGGAGFVDRVLARARAGERLRVVHDQVTAPTWARALPPALARLLPRLVRGHARGARGGAGAPARRPPQGRARLRQGGGTPQLSGARVTEDAGAEVVPPPRRARPGHAATGRLTSARGRPPGATCRSAASAGAPGGAAAPAGRSGAPGVRARSGASARAHSATSRARRAG